MTIDPTELKSWQPTRATTAAHLATQANTPQGRKECVALGPAGYISSDTNKWGQRHYRERWPYTHGTEMGSFQLRGQCNHEAPSTIDVVIDYGCLYSEIGAGRFAQHAGTAYSDLGGESVVGGVISNVHLHQWKDGGSYLNVGSRTNHQQRATYYVPELLGCHLTATQYHCLHDNQHDFCYHEGLTTPWSEPTIGTHAVVSLGLDAPQWDPGLPFDITVDFRAYLPTDSGLPKDYPKWAEDAHSKDGQTPDQSYLNVWVLGASAWVY